MIETLFYNHCRYPTIYTLGISLIFVWQIIPYTSESYSLVIVSARGIVVQSRYYIGSNSSPMGEVSKYEFLINPPTKYWRWFGTLSTDKLLSSLFFLVPPPMIYYARMKQMLWFKNVFLLTTYKTVP